MPSYRCLINGRNFLLDFDGKARKMGFYKSVYVESADTKAAELDAVEFIRSGELRGRVLNSLEDPPMIFVEEIDELESSGLEHNTSGHTFYKEKKWWQFWK